MIIGRSRRLRSRVHLARIERTREHDTARHRPDRLVFHYQRAGLRFLYAYWMRFGPSQWPVRCVLFVGIMGAVHLVGYRLWKHQQVAASEEPQARADADTWPAYREAIIVAIVQQVVVLFFAAMLLDGGQMLRLCGFGIWAVGCLRRSSWAAA